MDKSDLDRNFGFLIHDIARMMRIHFDRRGRELGLTRSQWWVLTGLYANEGVTQSELAEYMDIEKATLGRLLDRLEEKDWIERKADKSDRRIKRVYLTDTVQSLMRQLRAIGAEVRKDSLGGMDEVEHNAFVDTLLKIQSNLVAITETKAPASSAKEAADD